MAARKAKKITEEEARNIIGTEVRVIVRYVPSVIGRLVGKKHVKGVAHFHFRPVGGGGGAYVPAWDLLRL